MIEWLPLMSFLGSVMAVVAAAGVWVGKHAHLERRVRSLEEAVRPLGALEAELRGVRDDIQNLREDLRDLRNALHRG